MPPEQPAPVVFIHCHPLPEGLPPYADESFLLEPSRHQHPPPVIVQPVEQLTLNAFAEKVW